jgi:type II secretory pathway pseudopilin PulG
MSQDNEKGFTLIELVLAMSFISMLLIAIAMTTIQLTNIYTHGITLREVNQAGRSIADELQRNIASSSPFDVTPRDATHPDSKYVIQADGGRLCLGRYSYIWNYGENIAAGSANISNRYDNNEVIRFAKVPDAGGNLCKNPETSPIKTGAVDLLTTGDRDLAIHKFSIARTSNDTLTGQALYALSFTIGTNDQQQLTTNDASCKPPAEGVGDEAYCSVNQFDIVARAGNQAED